jgi:hypothetical protein
MFKSCVTYVEDAGMLRMSMSEQNMKKGIE